MPFAAAVLDTAARTPDAVAIAGEGRTLSYGDLVAGSGALAAALDDVRAQLAAPPTPAQELRGITATAVSLTSAVETARILGQLGLHRAVTAVLDPRWPLPHRVRVITRTGLDVVISEDPALPEALAEAGWTGSVLSPAALLEREAAARRDHRTECRGEAAGATGDGLGGGAGLPEPRVRDADEPFLLLFSSGTTADPKAFLKTRGQYRANLAVSAAHLEPLPGVQTLAPGPVSYALTLYAVIECLGTGGGVHLADSFDAAALAGQIASAQATRVVCVPAVVGALTAAAVRHPEAMRGVDLVVTGGANLPESLQAGLAAALPGVRLISYYGAAEIGFIGDSRAGDDGEIAVYPTIGAQIRDESGRPLPDGELGTLWIRAAACSDGYLAGTAEVELRGPDGWASVGDVGRLRTGESGPRLTLIGRSGDIAITGGHKVALTEVDAAFDGARAQDSARPQQDAAGEAAETAGDAEPVAEAAVCAIALPDEVLGSVVALVVEAPDSGPGADAGTREGRGAALRAQLRAIAEARLAPQFRPRRWYRMDRLPRTVGGKIRRGETLERVLAGEAERL